MQHFRADFDSASFGSILSAAVAAMCISQLVLPNRTTLPATREAGLVQIVNGLTEDG